MISVLFRRSLYHNIAKEKDIENIVISPVVVASSLGMVALGGKANTASQVKTVLSADKLKDEHLHTGLSELLNEVSSAVKHQHSLTPFKSLKLDPHHFPTSFPAEQC